jgi:hypothetical protein
MASSYAVALHDIKMYFWPLPSDLLDKRKTILNIVLRLEHQKWNLNNKNQIVKVSL